MGIKRSGSKPEATLQFVNSDLGAVTQNTWYTALEAANITVIGLGIQVTVAGETVELKVTIDGTTILTSAGVACAANEFTALPAYLRVTTLSPKFIQTAANANFDVGEGGVSGGLVLLWCKGHSVKIEARKTTAAGASHLIAVGAYIQR